MNKIKSRVKINKLYLGAEDSSKLSKILSLAEPPGVSRYGERRRHKSGQSDSSINTASTSRTNYSEPITTTNGEKLFRLSKILIDF